MRSFSMHSFSIFKRLDFRVIGIIALINFAGLLTISSFTSDLLAAPQGVVLNEQSSFFTPMTIMQIKWMVIGWVVFFFCAYMDYRKLREWVWVLYILSLFALIGLFFTDPIVRVQRWYKIPYLGIGMQPSEWAMIGTILSLSWLLERISGGAQTLLSWLGALCVVIVPFVLIVKQPDLGTALVLFPTACAMFYFGNGPSWMLKLFIGSAGCAALLVILIFTDVLPYDTVRPYASKVLKEYQLERLNPHTHHGKAAATAIALGGVSGVGYRQSEFWRGGSLPAPYTDSIFSAFGEEFGFIGLALLIFLYYALFYCCMQTVAVAKDAFGRLLAAGLAVELAFHVVINMAMMTGSMPISGIPLVFMSYGGSSLTSSMAALGLIQSVYSRRFMF